MGTEESRRYGQLRRLTEFSRALTYAPGVDQVLRLATSRAAEMFDAHRALLMLADEEGLLRVRATFGVEETLVERFRVPLAETLERRLRELLGSGPDERFLGVPLVAEGSLRGLLAVMRPGGTDVSEDEEWLLSALADQVAVALDNLQLAEAVRAAQQERAQAVRGAEEAGGVRDRALATLSHDLRSPLNVIDSYAELMEMEILGPIGDRQREALGRIRLSGRHLLAVLENVLEMARLAAGVVRVHIDRVDLGTVVDEAVVMLAHSAQGKAQQLHADSTPDIRVAADPDRLRQIVINLVGNAIKYTPAGGRIHVVASRREANGRSWGVVSVIDSGPGIPPDKLNVIFEPYYRIPGRDVEAQEGAGLGLAISRELARQMGGDIEVESVPGNGCTFTVLVPEA